MLLIDLLGTLAFAFTGAFRAVKYELDWLGVIVLATMTGVGGGLLRDLLLGSTPPVALRQPMYVGVCVVGAVLTIVAKRHIATLWDRVMLADALGLGFFAAVGAARAVVERYDGHHAVVQAKDRHKDEALELEVDAENGGGRLADLAEGE